MRWLLALAAGIAACDAGSSSEPEMAVEGCYTVALGAWAPAPEQYMAPPPRVELRTDVGDDGLEAGRRILRTPEGAPQSSYRWSWWEPFSADSVRIVFSTGFTGLQLRLGRHNVGLEGRAETFADHPETTAYAAATLSRTSCAQ